MLADTVSELTNAELVLSDDVLAGAVMELADAVLVGTNAVLVGTNAVLDLANDVLDVAELFGRRLQFSLSLWARTISDTTSRF